MLVLTLEYGFDYYEIEDSIQDTGLSMLVVQYIVGKAQVKKRRLGHAQIGNSWRGICYCNLH